ncbi:MAG: pirin family protein [Chlamydiales bacterium]
MIKVRTSKQRGYEDRGWLQSYYTFSFDAYYDPDFLNYRALRVINENTLKGGKGIGSHSHRDMEILFYVLDGVLEHKDNMGHSSVTRPGEVQRLSAGTGLTHSECNLSHHIPVRFLEFWITPEQSSVDPSYSKRLFSDASKWGQWCLIVSKNGREGSIRIYQDLDVFSTLLDDNDELSFETLVDRYYWIQVISGRFLIQESILEPGDGAAIKDESPIEIRCLHAGELLLFDLA